jgi:serine/threonine-protein kinase
LDDRLCSVTGKELGEHVNRLSHLPPRKNPFIGTVIDARYEVVRLIGSGGMAEVYEAKNLLLNRLVALKVVSHLTPTTVARFQREAQIIGGIHHPNVCDVYDFGQLPNGNPYLVLERLVGSTLDAALRIARFTLTEIVDIFVQVLCGLQHAHTHGIIHRDLKPGNIFLEERVAGAPLVKVLDFGLAKTIGGATATSTIPGDSPGTPAYMSPEQVAARPLTAQTDLFSVGLMMYEAIVRKHPFRARSLAETADNIMHLEVPDRPLRARAPTELADLVLRALNKSPDDRPRAAIEMQRILEKLPADCLDEEEPSSGSGSTSGILPRLFDPSSGSSST